MGGIGLTRSTSGDFEAVVDGCERTVMSIILDPVETIGRLGQLNAKSPSPGAVKVSLFHPSSQWDSEIPFKFPEDESSLALIALLRDSKDNPYVTPQLSFSRLDLAGISVGQVLVVNSGDRKKPLRVIGETEFHSFSCG
jgi:hypothetical protein